MTNEELVSVIRAGAQEKSLELLEQNAGIMRRVALRYWPIAQRNRGADFDDLLQAAALGLLAAVDAWDEDRGKFLTVAVFYMQKELCALLGLRGRERLENAAPPVSLFSPVDPSEEEGDCLAEFIPDAAAVDPQERAEQADMQRIVREGVGLLDPLPRAVICARALERRPWAQLAEETGCTAEAMRRAEREGLKQLRRNRKLLDLWREYGAACWGHVGVQSFSTTWTSATEGAVLRREWLAAQLSSCPQTGTKTGAENKSEY